MQKALISAKKCKYLENAYSIWKKNNQGRVIENARFYAKGCQLLKIAFKMTMLASLPTHVYAHLQPIQQKKGAGAPF